MKNLRLRKIPNLSLYVHIPFCKSKCWYCDFGSHPLDFEKYPRAYDFVHETMDHTIEQLDYFLEQIEPESIDTLYIGGGTPNRIKLSILDPFIMNILGEVGDKNIKEFTIECNPEFLTAEFIDHAHKWGVTRISMGIQSFNKKDLKNLGRTVTPEQIEKALDVLKTFRGDYNLDLICGVPKQYFTDFKKDVEKLLALEPSHISLYTLTIEENTKLWKLVEKKKVKPLPSEKQEEYWFWAIEELKKHGYNHYEISNFAKPGKESRHNMVYWEMRPYIGIGPGAVGTLPTENGIIRTENLKNIIQFWKNIVPANINVEEISPKEFLFDFIAMGFRTSFGISLERFASIFHISFERLFPKTLKKYGPSNTFQLSRGNLVLSEEGRYILNTILQDLLDELDSSGFNQEITWP